MKKIGTILMILILLFSILYATFFGKDFGWVFTFSLFIIIGLSTFAESFFGVTYLIVLQADQNLWISSIFKSICYILNIVLASILIVCGFGIHVVKLGSAFAFVLYPLVLNFYVKRKYKINLKDVDPDNSAIVQRWDAFWHQVAIFVNSNTDVVVLTVFSNMLEISVYSVYNLVITGLRRFITAVTNGVEGTFGDMIAKNEKSTLKDSLSIIELTVHSISIIIYTSAVILILQFVRIYTNGITDADYLRPNFAYLLLFSGFLQAIRTPYQFIIQASGHFKQTKKYAIVEVIINILTSIILVIKFGLVGVAIGTLVATLYKTVMYSNYMSINILERNCFVSFKKCIISFVEIGLIILIVSLLKIPMKVSYLSFILNGFVTVFISFIVVSFGILLFYRNDFIKLLHKIKNLNLKKRK